MHPHSSNIDVLLSGVLGPSVYFIDSSIVRYSPQDLAQSTHLGLSLGDSRDHSFGGLLCYGLVNPPCLPQTPSLIPDPFGIKEIRTLLNESVWGEPEQ